MENVSTFFVQDHYIIIRTKKRTVENCNGSLYEATRKAWRLNIDKVKKYKYVLACIGGIVKEVYEITNWYRSDEPHRIEFNGKVAPAQVRSLFINKKLPNIYSAKGNRNPVQYSRH